MRVGGGAPFVMERMEEKETRRRSPISAAQYTAPPPRSVLGVFSLIVFTAYSTSCVKNAAFEALEGRVEGCGWRSARVSSRAHFDGSVKVGLICVGLTVGS